MYKDSDNLYKNILLRKIKDLGEYVILVDRIRAIAEEHGSCKFSMEGVNFTATLKKTKLEKAIDYVDKELMIAESLGDSKFSHGYVVDLLNDIRGVLIEEEEEEE